MGGHLTRFYLLEVVVVDVLEAAIGHKSLRHLDALWCLVVLHDGSDNAWQCECRAIERVAEFGFLIGFPAISAFESVGLITLKIGC